MNKSQLFGNNLTRDKLRRKVQVKRGRGRREKIEKRSGAKYLFYSSLGVLIIMIVTFIVTYIVYTNKIKSSSYSELTTEKIAQLVPDNNDSQIEQASIDIGKSIEEAIKTVEDNSIDKEEKQKVVENKNEEVVQTEVKPVKVKDPEFSMPIEGEIIRNYSKDTLVYSETLQEWIIHLGIDIKAPRTSIVKAAESGTVESIKNDPRYGLTVIISHANGFKSIYSNLLTTEFVSEGDKVKKGQAIGTIGNSASFEIVDEPHLHFEILKDDENVDPCIYIK